MPNRQYLITKSNLIKKDTENGKKHLLSFILSFNMKLQYISTSKAIQEMQTQKPF